MIRRTVLNFLQSFLVAMFTKLQFYSSVFSGSLPVSDALMSHPFTPHEFWMKKALDQAVLAFDQGEVPVGVIIVHQEKIIAEACNQREMLNDPTAHAEMIAITQAAEVLQSWRLLDCTLYVTLEPCPMCAGAIVQARIPRVIYGATDPKAGACHTLFSLTSDIRLNHQAAVLGGVMQEDCRAILQEFFRQQRALGKK
jgi:tRNA(adenine34) deaminase